MTTLIEDVWEQIVWQYQEPDSDRTAVGVVIRSDLYGAMIAKLTRSPLVYESGPGFYFDNNQACEALVFYDTNLLKAYLNRIADPDGWQIAVAEAITTEAYEHSRTN